jgi:hypothetical protein
MIAQLVPSSPAYAHRSRPTGALDAGGGVHRVAPHVVLKLRLSHDPGRHRPVIDPDPHTQAGPKGLRRGDHVETAGHRGANRAIVR